jgi:hypothetical protein
MSETAQNAHAVKHVNLEGGLTRRCNRRHDVCRRGKIEVDDDGMRALSSANAVVRMNTLRTRTASLSWFEKGRATCADDGVRCLPQAAGASAPVRPCPHGRPFPRRAPSTSTAAQCAHMRAWVSAGPSGGSSFPWHPFWPDSRLPGSRASPQKARSARYPRALQVVATTYAALGGSHVAVLPRRTVSTGCTDNTCPSPHARARCALRARHAQPAPVD